MLGREIALVDAAVRLRTEPLDWERFAGLLPMRPSTAAWPTWCASRPAAS
jgi:hypothetical protein